MLKKMIIFSTLAMFLSACVTGSEGYLKRSANNKIIDRKGFKGGKRAPLYNKKYISQAKKNVVTGDEFNDLDEDDSEEENISKDNIAIYKAMIDHDLSQDRKNKKDSKWSKNKNSYPSLRKSSNRLNDDDEDMQNMGLREELNQIKSMLNDTKREMANNRCPAMVQDKKQQPATISTNASAR